MDNPNSLDNELNEAQAPAQSEGTEQKEPVETVETQEAAPEIDYKEKFVHSSEEGIRLAKENKRLSDELKAKEAAQLETTPPEHDDLYPGFDQLDPEAQENLIKYTHAVTKRAKAEIQEDPAIAFARESYAKHKWETAFTSVKVEFPDLDDTDFRAKYYNASNVPDNISDLLTNLAKVELYDKAKDLGAQEQVEKTERVQIEETRGGEKTVTTRRTLDEWSQMAKQNPAKFASLKKEYSQDLESGHLTE